ncbi:MAG: hypothetical protein DMG47_03920 [Acidobacteria bacterium]|nr:MAG: hypothetical protein DMG47_03920 [Acidobacteriota bacterium]
MKRLLIAISVATALWSAACGSGGSSVQPPPPAGKYSLASLNGQYAFVTNGEVFTSGASFPMEDVNADGTPSNAIAITNGTYTVSADGRGAMTLNLGTSTLDFGITLTSNSDGLLIDETSNSNQASTGSGNFILQQSTPFALSEIAGTYVFDFSGSDASQPNPNPESFIGQFVVDSNTQTIPTGFFDDNVGGELNSGAMTPGTIAQDPLQTSSFSAFGRGIATIAGQNFVFYIVNSGRVRFLSTNNGMLSGDAVSQAGIPGGLTGGFVFVVGGSSPNGGLTRVGRFTVSNMTLGQMLMDVNDASNEAQFNNLSNGSITSYDSTTGRAQVSFQDSGGQAYSFVFYLSSANSGVIQDISPSGTVGFARVTADGSIELQSGSPFTSANVSGTYAMNWSGLVVAGGSFPIEDEEDLLAQANVTNLTISGAADLFQFTSATLTPRLDLGVGGAIQINGDGASDDGHRNGMTVNLTGANPINFVVYVVNPQLAFFANRDNSGTPRVVVGILKLQQ